MKSAAGLALAWVVLNLASAASAQTQTQQTQWDLATNYPAGAFHTRNIVQFAADVDKATGGSLKIGVHPGGTMIKHAEIKRAVGEGRAAAGEVLISLAADEAPVYGVDSIPFLATGYDGARKLYDAQKPFLEKQLDKEGLVLLFSVPWPPQGIYAKREIKAIDELKGLKFRTYNAMTKRIAELAGARPTQIEVPDLAAAFASGRVDVMITSASSGFPSQPAAPAKACAAARSRGWPICLPRREWAGFRARDSVLLNCRRVASSLCPRIRRSLCLRMPAPRTSSI